MDEDFLSPQQLADIGATFRGSGTRRLVERHRGGTWLIETAFRSEFQSSNDSAVDKLCLGVGDLAGRRLGSHTWVPWPRGNGGSTDCVRRSRALPAFMKVPHDTNFSDAAVSTRHGGGHRARSVAHNADESLEDMSASEDLVKRFRDTDERIRWRTARALSSLGEAAAAQTALLTERVQNDVDASTRWAAAEALGRASSATETNGNAVAQKVLVAASLVDANRSVRWAAADALPRISSPLNARDCQLGKAVTTTLSRRVTSNRADC
eukprot:TRINITY_DN70886_c0_g1_i1.p1 TRINITY_DN70886_c0_g1~~TRINITY_DN70886_c0_g1_i1.p1  ORF type:complete len:285 (-),score=41.72 TRINITY_DN70886_c0_g1_i1:80-877(-)